MDKQPVGQLPDLSQSTNDNEIMVITNPEYNTLQKEKISNLITDFMSKNTDNALIKGTDNKLFVKNYGNADNITEGTLPVSVLPNIPKDKLPDIEITDLPASGVTADTYAYPSSVTVNAQGQVTAIEEGTPSGSNANVDLSNITDAGKEVIKENSGGSGLEVGDIGIAAFGVDETKGLRRLLNGTILTVNANTQGFVNKLKTAVTSYPSLACTEDEWQEISSTSVGGQCGKFVLNYDTDETTVVSVRLPKIIMPVQGLTDMTKLGELVDAGLPNIEGSHGGLEGANFYRSGAFTIKDTTQRKGAGAGDGDCYVSFDASLSNPIYGNSETVQPEQVQYPYFIQIATGLETEVNITNEIELNNPYTLFDSKYSEAPLYNASWLKSSTTYYPKSVYTTAYEALVVENNSEVEAGDSVTLPSGKSYIKRGLSVKLSTAEDITDYDFVINTTDETFRLPLKNGSEALPGTTYTEPELPATSGSYALPSNGYLTLTKRATASGQTVEMLNNTRGGLRQGSHSGATNNYLSALMGGLFGDEIRINYNAGGTIERFRFLEACGNGILYYYIGETVQNANLINAGRLAEQLNDKINFQQAAAAGMPSNHYVDLTLGASETTYTAPANGYIYLAKEATAQNQYIYLFSYTSDNPSEDKKLGTFVAAPKTGWWIEAYLPVQQGDKFTVQYTLGGTTHYFKFIYNQGEDMN